MAQLHCSVSIIKNIEPIADYHDWTIGRHGLHVFYELDGEKHNAYYLPEVAREKGKPIRFMSWSSLRSSVGKFRLH